MSCSKDNEIDNQSALDQELDARSTHDICIMSWNTWLLDTPTHPFGESPQCEENCENRALSICETILESGVEIVNLQEVFEDAGAQPLIRCLEDAGYQVLWDKTSGLLTASTFEMELGAYQTFSAENGWDKFKDKGFVIHNIKIDDDCYIHNVNTHLQSGGGILSTFNRKRQWAQLTRTLRFFNDFGEFIISGDLNMDYGSGESEIIGESGFNPSFVLSGDSAEPTKEGSDDVLDYILFQENTQISNVTTEVLACEETTYFNIIDNFQEDEFSYFGDEAPVDRYPEPFYTIEGPWSTENCVSDHYPVLSCFEYDCD